MFPGILSVLLKNVFLALQMLAGGWSLKCRSIPLQGTYHPSKTTLPSAMSYQAKSKGNVLTSVSGVRM